MFPIPHSYLYYTYGPKFKLKLGWNRNYTQFTQRLFKAMLFR